MALRIAPHVLDRIATELPATTGESPSDAVRKAPVLDRRRAQGAPRGRARSTASAACKQW
jgi:hypothetical protein